MGVGARARVRGGVARAHLHAHVGTAAGPRPAHPLQEQQLHQRHRPGATRYK